MQRYIAIELVGFCRFWLLVLGMLSLLGVSSADPEPPDDGRNEKSIEFERTFREEMSGLLTDEEQAEYEEIVEFQIQMTVDMYKQYAQEECTAGLLPEIEEYCLQQLKTQYEEMIFSSDLKGLKRIKSRLDMAVAIAVRYICEHDDWREQRQTLRDLLTARSFEVAIDLIEVLQSQNDIQILVETQKEEFQDYYEYLQSRLSGQLIPGDSILDSVIDSHFLVVAEEQRKLALEAILAELDSPLVVGFALSAMTENAPATEEFRLRAKEYIEGRTSSLERLSLDQALFTMIHPILYHAVGIENLPRSFHFSSSTEKPTYSWRKPFKISPVQDWVAGYEKQRDQIDLPSRFVQGKKKEAVATPESKKE